MKKVKQLGIWMDHSNAILMDNTNSAIVQRIVVSDFTHEEKELALSKNENLMHNKEQHEQNEYYKEIGESIRNYDKVLLFGPTNAKVELLNLLKSNHRYASIEIEVKNADKMADNEKHAFVKNYFK